MVMRFKVMMLAVAMTSGCATTDPASQSTDPAFGEAVKHNAAIQIINPDPVDAPGSAQPGEMAEQGQAAVKRLRTGEANDQHREEVGAAKNSSLSTTEGTKSGPQ
jgi:hypothetical protein